MSRSSEKRGGELENLPHTLTEFPDVFLLSAFGAAAAWIEHWDYENSQATAKNFPSQETRECVDMALVRFDQPMTIEQVKNWLIAKQARGELTGYTLAGLEHLKGFAFHEEYMPEQHGHFVVAGRDLKEIDGELQVPFTVAWEGERKLDLLRAGGRWDPLNAFLLVRTSPGT